MQMTRRNFTLAGLATAGLVMGHGAAALDFDAAWTHQTFPRQEPNSYGLAQDHLDIVSDGSVSLLIREVPMTLWTAQEARWTWEVTQSVPVTDLGQRGGDDRNLAIYFVFFPERTADQLRGASPRRILTNRAARILVYTWGGGQSGRRVFPNPWLDGQGFTIALRPAGTGSFNEAADLRSDFAEAFGAEAGALFGVGVSSDSDDSDSAVRAKISGLRLT